jgi:hypothetical protein
MASTATPYGLQPVNRVDGMPYAGATETFLINPAGTATNIFNGSIVALDTNGFVVLMTATGADGTTNAFPAGTLGVFVGCEYFNAQGQLIFSQQYPSGTTGVVKAKVVTDPNVVFQGQLNGSGAQAVLGANTFLAAAQSTSTGNVRTGNSTVALSTTVQTAAAAFRIVGFASTPGDAFTDVLVKFNPGQHSYLNAVGI